MGWTGDMMLFCFAVLICGGITAGMNLEGEPKKLYGICGLILSLLPFPVMFVTLCIVMRILNIQLAP